MVINKDYITNYRIRVPNYYTYKAFMQDSPQTVHRYGIKEDYCVYDYAIINLTEKQLID
ncbi:hypothetical protein [Nosocomiicoccus ampullae]|uniref:hypothetical protein n=1 Tax=Nosocomiicoccus ampullae TaxID=489910 RepID=UPI00214F10B8|nr:hypothetical protein [Nosocomiicoccus ampullae]